MATRLTKDKMAAAATNKPPLLKVFENGAEVAQNLCVFVSIVANQAIKDRGIFTVGVSGK